MWFLLKHHTSAGSRFRCQVKRAAIEFTGGWKCSSRNVRFHRVITEIINIFIQEKAAQRLV